MVQILMVALSRIPTMLKTWVAIIVLAQVADAFSFPSASTSSRLFRPTTLSSRTTQRIGATVSPGVVGASSSFRPRVNSQLSLSIRHKFTHPTGEQTRHSRRRRHIFLSAASSSDSNDEQSPSSTTTTVTTNGENNEGELSKLKKENKLLQERLKLLQIQNDELLQQQHQQTQQPSDKTVPYEQRLILEDFEGEGIPTLDARGGVVDGWNKSERRYTEPWDEAFTSVQSTTATEGADYEDELGLAEPIEEDEVCEYDDQTDKWTSGVGECPVEPNVTFVDAMKSRAYWLVGLLALQSCSGFILSRNELLLQDHPVIIYFLTMLVGAGGNAGNQASVRVIRGLALGTLNPQTQSRFLNRELRMACALSVILSLAGFVRAIVFQTPFPETMAVTLALSMIVFSSICLGAVLPLLLQRVGVDPAHSSTTIQVVMDILGVVLTVFVSTMVLDSVWGKTLIKALGHMGL